MGRKSKPIMHLIILLCGLFMHLISTHPYSSPAAALTHVDQLATAKLKGRCLRKKYISKYKTERDSYSKKVNQVKHVKFQPIMPGNLNVLLNLPIDAASVCRTVGNQCPCPCISE